MAKHHLLILLALLAVIVLAHVSPAAALACPTCKDSLASADPQHANLVRGYFWSIIFMMSMPFLILAGLGALFYYEIRRARRNAPPGEPAIPAMAGRAMPQARR